MYEQGFRLGGNNFYFGAGLLLQVNRLPMNDINSLIAFIKRYEVPYPVLFEYKGSDIVLRITGESSRLSFSNGKYYIDSVEHDVLDFIVAVNNKIRERIAFLPINEGSFRICSLDNDHDGEVFELCPDHSDLYFFNNQRCLLSFIKDRFDLVYDDLVRRFGLMSDGIWPIGTRESQMNVIFTLNGQIRDVETKSSFKDNVLRIGNERYTIEVSKSGLYYLKGNMHYLYKLLHISGRNDFVCFINGLLGKDGKYPGVSPEFRERDDLITVIKSIVK